MVSAKSLTLKLSVPSVISEASLLVLKMNLSLA